MSPFSLTENQFDLYRRRRRTERESGDAGAKVVEAARGNQDDMCGAPGGRNTGHVFNQRQQNAFIKPITGKSCGAEPHSHFHYRLSGDSHLHLTWRFPPTVLSASAISVSCILFYLLDASLLICRFTSTVFANTSLLSPYFACEYLQVHSSSFHHNDTEGKRPLWWAFTDLEGLTRLKSVNVTQEFFQICRRASWNLNRNCFSKLKPNNRDLTFLIPACLLSVL